MKALMEAETPCLLLDAVRMDRNIARLQARMDAFGVMLRPHMKTAKSIDVAARVMAGAGAAITVSTLKEAEEFAAAGVRDMLYAVTIAPGKLGRAAALCAQTGGGLMLVVDSVAAAEAVAAHARESGTALRALIEIDVDGKRAGVKAGDAAALLAVGRALQEGGAGLAGVMTHAGGSYAGGGPGAMAAAAETERAGAVLSARILREAGLPAPIVSVGSTPTAHFARDLAGVSEVRAGVYMFFDLVMAGLGVCGLEDIAISVLATVIGHQHGSGDAIIDAGWTALSRDRGTAGQAVDQGYGLVCDVAGRPFDDLIVREVNQEHGILALREGSGGRAPRLPIGTQVRVLPNHACATAAQHGAYAVMGAGGRIEAEWPRFGGW